MEDDYIEKMDCDDDFEDGNIEKMKKRMIMLMLRKMRWRLMMFRTMRSRGTKMMMLRLMMLRTMRSRGMKMMMLRLMM